MRRLGDVGRVDTVVIRHVAVVVSFHQRQIVHEHLLGDLQQSQQLATLEHTYSTLHHSILF